MPSLSRPGATLDLLNLRPQLDQQENRLTAVDINADSMWHVTGGIDLDPVFSRLNRNSATGSWLSARYWRSIDRHQCTYGLYLDFK